MISILCPTRKRPHNMKRLLRSIVETAAIGEIEVLIYVDDDDLETQLDRRAIADTAATFPIRWIVGPRITMSDMWNALIPHAAGDLLMMMGDDVIFKTVGWDAMIEKAFHDSADKILLVHGDDEGPGGKHFASLPVVHRRWFEIVGYFAGPGFSADYADTWPNDVADIIGRKRFLPYVTTHAHPAWGKAQKDETYLETDARLRRDNTPQLYQDRMQERIADANKLREALLP